MNTFDRDVCVANFPDAYAQGQSDRLNGRNWRVSVKPYNLLSGEKKAYTFGFNEVVTEDA